MSGQEAILGLIHTRLQIDDNASEDAEMSLI